VKSLPHSDIEDLYLFAQLVADDAEEASALLSVALAERERGNRSEADVLIKEVWSRQTPSRMTHQDGAWLARRQVPAALEDMLPRLMARLRPSRRMAIVKAFRTEGPAASDRSVFLISVKRALESDGLHSVADRLTLEALEESMRRYLDSQMAPVPDSLLEAWEQKRLPASSRPARRSSRFPLSARVALGVLIILLSAAIGSWITSPSANAPAVQSELFDELSGLSMDDPEFRASNPDQVERFLDDRLGWRLAVPRLREGSIEGVSIARLGPDLQFPAIHYTDQANESDLMVFVLDYRFLESARSTFLIDDRILDQIADSGGIDIRNAPEYFRVTWRFRDDIYVAMAPATDTELRDRFQFD